ncbi:uncharacterized protein METZ01_LOCUS399443 [marine metagenome]|uniref:Uncharacterized protein n=1 Tax=marine metagenome TaxID=408172 RepID=A0A382VJ86_9ZZZZ
MDQDFIQNNFSSIAKQILFSYLAL